MTAHLRDLRRPPTGRLTKAQYTELGDQAADERWAAWQHKRAREFLGDRVLDEPACSLAVESGFPIDLIRRLRVQRVREIRRETVL